jgi:hypothetical protein
MIKEFPYHHYIVGKFFLKGIPGVVEKNIEYSAYFFSLGANYKENYYFINSFYSKKCMNYLRDNNELKNFQNLNTSLSSISLDNFINEENICIVCFSNYKQIIYVKCGHKCICYLCFEKINKTEESVIKKSSSRCPMCQQESYGYINSFETDFEIHKIDKMIQ